MDTQLLSRLEKIEQQLDALNKNTRPMSIGMRLLHGMAWGLGTVLGATVIVSVVLAITQPLSRVQAIGPQIERLTNALEHSGKK